MVGLAAVLDTQLQYCFKILIEQPFKSKGNQHIYIYIYMCVYILPMKSVIRRPLEDLPVRYLKKVSP